MNLVPPDHVKLEIENRKIKYFENDFRICTASETIENIYAINDKTGVITRLYKIEPEKFMITPVYVSRFRKPLNLMFPEQIRHIYPKEFIECYGKGVTEVQCQVSALMEAIERYSSFLTNGELIEASYNEVKDIAIDPETLIIGSNHYRNYSKDLKIKWTWAYSLITNKSILVPALFVYIVYFNPKNSDMAFLDTNGLSCGNCMEEAILHGVFEVLERDSLMIMHRNKLCMPDVDPKTSRNKYIQKTLEILGKHNVKYYVKNTTTDIQIPSFSVLLVHEIERTTAYSHTVCAHINPDLALLRTFTEALQGYEMKGHSAWLDSCTIDHLYQQSKARMTMDDITDNSSKVDLKVNIEKVIDIFRENNLDILVANLTCQKIGFPVVRILIPTLQSFDGEENPRFSKRLFEIPKKLGYRTDHSTKGELMMGPSCGTIKPQV